MFAHGTTAGLNKPVHPHGRPHVACSLPAATRTRSSSGASFQKVDGPREREITDVSHLDKADAARPARLIRGVSERVDYKGAVVVALNRDEAAPPSRDCWAGA